MSKEGEGTSPSVPRKGSLVRILSIDGSYLLHRGRFIVDKYDGFKHEDQLISHFLQTIFPIMEMFHPDSAYVYFDRARSPHRLKHIQEYKAHRKEDPLRPLYSAAREFLHKALPHFGIVTLLEDGIEADDFAYYLAQCYNKDTVEDFHSGVHVTEDRDWYLSLFHGWHVYLPRAKELVKYSDFCHMVGTDNEPRMVYLVAKAITGDKSDNINGVRGVGWESGLRLAKQIVFQGEVIDTDRQATLVRKQMPLVMRNIHVMNLTWVTEDETAKHAILTATTKAKETSHEEHFDIAENVATTSQRSILTAAHYQYRHCVTRLIRGHRVT